MRSPQGLLILSLQRGTMGEFLKSTVLFSSFMDFLFFDQFCVCVYVSGIGILVHSPAVELVLQWKHSPNHWITREFCYRLFIEC